MAIRRSSALDGQTIHNRRSCWRYAAGRIFSATTTPGSTTTRRSTFTLVDDSNLASGNGTAPAFANTGTFQRSGGTGAGAIALNRDGTAAQFNAGW